VRRIDELDPADIVPFDYGQADTPAVQPSTNEGEPAPEPGENNQQQLTDSVNRLNETLTKILQRQNDQPPKSEKLQPATSLNDLFAPQPQEHDHAHEEEPDEGEEPEAEQPVTFEKTSTASVASGGFQQQQQAGAVDMGQGLNANAAVEQMQALLQAQNDSQQKTLQILQNMQGIIVQQVQMQHQYSHKLEEIDQQVEGLKAIVEEMADQLDELQTQQRNPQNFKGNP
jgi:hypothetical protein